MADYAFRTLEQRQKVEALWAAKVPPKQIAERMGVSEMVIYTELRRGRDGTRSEDGRLRYSAEAAQRKVDKSLESRGRKPIAKHS